ncbi:DUF6470 family protein [Metabacillus rhizolycopersici]|uniref:DUF6470 family protein n=1 Tax=Metabacillus rhizolycopersici TaxID=2875709 RepID=A0ABS7URZ7_9BACI|nr:DUF6470 family protein [Metabacillus rhizolycopersici]MBZ5750824.1 DUF6470 family protein [Metabacillus rhizolycopersici]
MNVPQIRLQSISAQLGIHTTKGQQTIEQPKAELSMEQPKAELTIETTPSTLSIDQTEAWADMDLKHISRRVSEAAQQGYQDALAGIARRAEEGEQLKRIEDGGNPLADLAKKHSEKPMYPFNIGFIPSAGSVKIHYEPAKVNIEAKMNKSLINATVHKPIIDYQPGNVEVELERRNELSIDFESVNKGE